MNKIMDNFGVFDYLETAEGTYEYSAAEMRAYFAGIIGNGVLKGAGGEFAASAEGLQVTLDSGEAWLLGVHGNMVDSSVFTLDPVVSGMSRICSFVLDADITNMLMGISILDGTQAESPSAPTLFKTAIRYQQVIFNVQVFDDGTVAISDERTLISKAGDGVTPESIGAAAKSVLVTAVLEAGNWTDDAYTLTSADIAALSAITADTAWEVLIGLTATDEEIDAIQEANFLDGGQSAGSITIRAKNGAPTIDVPIRIICRGDLYA